MSKNDLKILMILDNASSHCIDEELLTHVKILKLPPNTTCVLQPMDAGIIAAFKRRYRKLHMRHSLRSIGSDAAGGSSGAYTVTQLEAMKWCKMVWDDVPQNIIKNCWRRTGIVPDAPATGGIQNILIIYKSSTKHFFFNFSLTTTLCRFPSLGNVWDTSNTGKLFLQYLHDGEVSIFESQF